MVDCSIRSDQSRPASSQSVQRDGKMSACRIEQGQGNTPAYPETRLSVFANDVRYPQPKARASLSTSSQEYDLNGLQEDEQIESRGHILNVEEVIPQLFLRVLD